MDTPKNTPTNAPLSDRHPRPPDFLSNAREEEEEAPFGGPLQFSLEAPPDPRIADLRGHRYFALTALGYAGPGTRGSRWVCECICRSTVAKDATLLMRSKQAHCGCLANKPKAVKEAVIKEFLRKQDKGDYRTAQIRAQSWQTMMPLTPGKVREEVLEQYITELERYQEAQKAREQIRNLQMAFMKKKGRRLARKAAPGTSGSVPRVITLLEIEDLQPVQVAKEFVARRWQILRWAAGNLIFFYREEAERREIIEPTATPRPSSEMYELVLTGRGGE